jgi:hypothetical protein
VSEFDRQAGETLEDHIARLQRIDERTLTATQQCILWDTLGPAREELKREQDAGQQSQPPP